MKNFQPVIKEIHSKEDKQQCSQIFTSSEPWISLGITESFMMKTLNDPLHEVFAVVNDQHIIGTFVLQTRGAFTGYIKSIAIKRGWRGKGLGVMMMNFIEEKIFGVTPNVFLCVSSFNKDAQRFYKKLGYENVGLLKNYVIEGADEILMRKTMGPLL